MVGKKPPTPGCSSRKTPGEPALAQRLRRNISPKNLDLTAGLSWREERELNKALYASLQETKKLTIKSELDLDSPLVPSNSIPRRNLLARVLPRRQSPRSSKPVAPVKSMSMRSPTLPPPSDKRLKSQHSIGGDESSQDSMRSSTTSCSNDDLKGTKVRAQRKFAQMHAYGNTMVPSQHTPVKQSSKTSSPIKVFPKRAKTEDFLTFLCLRGTQTLPPHLDFFNFSRDEGDTSLPPTPPNRSRVFVRESSPSSSSTSCSNVPDEVADSPAPLVMPPSGRVTPSRKAARACAGTPETARGLASFPSRQGQRSQATSKRRQGYTSPAITPAKLTRSYRNGTPSPMKGTRGKASPGKMTDAERLCIKRKAIATLTSSKLSPDKKSRRKSLFVDQSEMDEKPGRQRQTKVTSDSDTSSVVTGTNSCGQEARDGEGVSRSCNVVDVNLPEVSSPSIADVVYVCTITPKAKSTPACCTSNSATACSDDDDSKSSKLYSSGMILPAGLKPSLIDKFCSCHTQTPSLSSEEVIPCPSETPSVSIEEAIPYPTKALSVSAEGAVPSPTTQTHSTQDVIFCPTQTHPISTEDVVPYSTQTHPISTEDVIPCPTKTNPISTEDVVPYPTQTHPISTEDVIPYSTQIHLLSTEDAIPYPTQSYPVYATDVIPCPTQSYPLYATDAIPCPTQTHPISTEDVVPYPAQSHPLYATDVIPCPTQSHPFYATDAIPCPTQTHISTEDVIPCPTQSHPLYAMDVIPCPTQSHPLYATDAIPCPTQTHPISTEDVVPYPTQTHPISTEDAIPCPTQSNPVYATDAIPYPTQTPSVSTEDIIPCPTKSHPVSTEDVVPCPTQSHPVSTEDVVPCPTQSHPVYARDAIPCPTQTPSVSSEDIIPYPTQTHPVSSEDVIPYPTQTHLVSSEEIIPCSSKLLDSSDFLPKPFPGYVPLFSTFGPLVKDRFNTESVKSECQSRFLDIEVRKNTEHDIPNSYQSQSVFDSTPNIHASETLLKSESENPMHFNLSPCLKVSSDNIFHSEMTLENTDKSTQTETDTLPSMSDTALAGLGDDSPSVDKIKKVVTLPQQIVKMTTPVSVGCVVNIDDSGFIDGCLDSPTPTSPFPKSLPKHKGILAKYKYKTSTPYLKSKTRRETFVSFLLPPMSAPPKVQSHAQTLHKSPVKASSTSKIMRIDPPTSNVIAPPVCHIIASPTSDFTTSPVSEPPFSGKSVVHARVNNCPIRASASILPHPAPPYSVLTSIREQKLAMKSLDAVSVLSSANEIQPSDGLRPSVRTLFPPPPALCYRGIPQ